MLPVKQLKRNLSEAEFLLFEEHSKHRHEYHDGQIYAMVGGTNIHSQLSVAVLTELARHLDKSPYVVFGSDMKVRIPHAQGLSFVYPDAVVSCDPRDLVPKTYLEHPLVVVEVLSRTTAKYDLNEKFDLYQHLPTLVDYVLVSQYKRRIEVFHRRPDQVWELTISLPDAAWAIPSLKYAGPVERLYAKITGMKYLV